MNTRKLYLYNLISLTLPPTRCFALKRMLLRWAGAHIGSDVRIVSSARFHLTGELVIGDRTWIGNDVLFAGGQASIHIGCDVDIAPRVLIVTGSHDQHTVRGKAAGHGFSSPIYIDDGVWLGASATVLGGIKIGQEAIVAAGALICKDVAPGVTVGGVPARVLSAHTTV